MTLRDSLKSGQKRRIGVQVKAMLILTLVVLSATTAGGWLYYSVTRDLLRHNDYVQADRLAAGLAVASVPGLKSGDREALYHLATNLLNDTDIHCVQVLDRNSEALANAERVRPGIRQYQLASMPASMSYELHRGTSFLELGRPVVDAGSKTPRDMVVGGIRLVMDTRQTVATLGRVRQQISLIAAGIILCTLPLGYVLVWRVMVVPVRRLVVVTSRLANGDLAARADSDRNDEFGELAYSFDVMAESLQASRRQLCRANESLERKVAERTGELEQANNRLRDEMAEKEDFLRAVSHDLNAPLRNIAGMATMITMRHRDTLPEDVVARLGRIQANVESETDLIGELLELSRIRSRPQRRELTDFGQVLRDLRDTFDYELKHKNITLTVAEDLPELYVERSRIRGAFQNLIDNAIKYMGDRPDGSIQVRYEHTGGEHRFLVTDNGPGIDPADQQKIFYVFRRAAATSSSKVPGKGVGLAWVKSVVSNYDGRLWVESVPGEGSTFVVALSDGCTCAPPAEPAAQADEENEYVEAGSHTSG